MKSVVRFLLCSLCVVAGHARSEPLTVARLFALPDLSGPRLSSPKISPDGRYVTFLQGKPDNKDQLDLWGFDVRSGRSLLLVDSRAFIRGEEQLSPEEEARRERQRTASLRGIVEYQFSPDGHRLLVPIGGDLYMYDLDARAQSAVRRITNSASYETDSKFSPKGRFVSYVRDQNLWIYDLQTSVERQLTTDGGALIGNGVAEFVAQEEMDRDTGYWWSPDDARIAFERMDNAPVDEIERTEIYADKTVTVRQRYPAAGARNALVELKVIELNGGNVTNIDLGSDRDIYLARVDWFPDSRSLAIQRQPRNQQRLDLLKSDVSTGRGRVLLSETSRTWINLSNNLAFVPERRAFVWASERTGFRHLYLYGEGGEFLRPVTSGSWMVLGDVKAENIDAKRGLIFFTANQTSPLEQHLYATSLETIDPNRVQKVSREAGSHGALLFPDLRSYLDAWSAPEQPPSIAIRNIDGSLKKWIVRNELNDSHPYAPYLSDQVAEEFGSLKASDGQDLYYRLIKPAKMIEGKRYPVIVDTYGGPGFQNVYRSWMGSRPSRELSSGRSTDGFFRQLLAQRGYVVFSLDNRGSGQRGVAFEAPLYKQMGKVEIQDQLKGIDYLKSLPFVDASRIGIMGWSYGGYMTLMALATAPDVFKAGVAGAPVTDWHLYDTHYTERFLSDPVQNASGYTASSVFPYLNSIKGKLLLVHGMADDNVLFAHSTQLMKRLQDANIQFDLMTYPGGKHGLTRQTEMGTHFYETTLRFFAENL